MPSIQPKVHILLSTYNGEKYLSQQLDSLLSQTYPNITIYIRDDGSKDDTLQIISHYVKVSQDTSDPKIVFLPPDGKNLGYMSSFWLLLRECGSADYYAFCDQDDVWLPDKVECGIAALEKEEAALPLLYSSSFIYCDENMNFTGNPVEMSDHIAFKDVMFYTPAFGFTILINEALRQKALSASSLDKIPHDGWCQKIAASMGKFIYDPRQTGKYRRHSSTVTYANSSKLQLIGKWIQNDLFGIGLSEYYFILERFFEEYGSQLSPHDRKALELFRTHSGVKLRYFKKLFYPERLRPSLGGELALRICFGVGR